MRDVSSGAKLGSNPLITGLPPRWGFATPHHRPHTARTNPRCWRHGIPWFVSLCCLLSCLILSGTPVFGQTQQEGTDSSAASPAQANADVIVLVIPQSADQAQIALVYQNRVPEERVRREVQLLAKASGGKLADDLKIESKSIRPRDLTNFPIRTGASFTLLHSPQVHDSAPTLAPYLTAFQSWDHVEVIFSLPDLNPYNGVESLTARNSRYRC
ncbi:MAG TPA: hypothetical protein VKU00_23645 [Chthonomonadaceae bacterium]|nr:hypothetical protein [Chthonomonadaceae bacterium]